MRFLYNSTTIFYLYKQEMAVSVKPKDLNEAFEGLISVVHSVNDARIRYRSKSLTYSLNELASSLYALIVCVSPFGQITVTVTIFTSASEAEIAG